MSTNGPHLRCVAYRPMCRGSLRGFASIAFYLGDAAGPKFILHSIGIHTHENGANYAAPPSQAVIRDGAAVKDPATGKVTYGPPLLEFSNKDARRSWSDAVVRAVLAYDPNALQRGAA